MSRLPKEEKEKRATARTVTVSVLEDAARHSTMELTWSRPPGFIGWLSSTNHKDVALRWIATAFIFFLLAGVIALLMRFQLAFPENHFLGPDRYNQFFTVHGSAMMFLFAVPIMEAFSMYLIPLMIGTRNVAFPRLNAFGYFSYLAGGLLLFTGLFLNIGPDTGWFAYVPLSGPAYSPGKRVDFWAQMITLTEFAALVTGIETIATVFKQRAIGMGLHRIPLYVWAMVITAFMTIFAMPAVMLASGMLAMDRLTNVNTQFFNPSEGGDAILYQHIFWFFGHPEVYLIFIPATGFVSTLISTFSRRPMFGHLALILSLIGTAFIGFGLWVHHMFATPLPVVGQSFFTGASMIIAIPSGIQVFCWIATVWSGKPQFKTPMLFALGFIAIFVLGGLSGIMLSSVPVDLQVHDTYFVVAHFHYVLIGGAIFPLFGALYYWFPKWTGRLLDERLGKWNFWLFFIAFNITFFPMHILGLHGMTRRIYTYGAETGWGPLNGLASAGAGLLGISVLLFVINVVRSIRSGALAGDNPWGASTLEWATTSPPPSYNFLYLPTVQGQEPLWDKPVISPVVVGTNPEKREVLTTTLMEAAEDHRYELCTDSIWPFTLATVSGITIAAAIFTAWAVPIGAFFAYIALIFWFWRENEPQHLTSEKHKHPSPFTLPVAYGGEGSATTAP